MCLKEVSHGGFISGYSEMIILVFLEDCHNFPHYSLWRRSSKFKVQDPVLVPVIVPDSNSLSFLLTIIYLNWFMVYGTDRAIHKTRPKEQKINPCQTKCK